MKRHIFIFWDIFKTKKVNGIGRATSCLGPIRLLRFHPPGHPVWEQNFSNPLEEPPSLGSRARTISEPVVLWSDKQHESLYFLCPAWGYAVSLDPGRQTSRICFLKELAPFTATGNEDNRPEICCRRLLNHLLYQHYTGLLRRLATGKIKQATTDQLGWGRWGGEDWEVCVW